MQLNKIDDPRDALSKARRVELIAHARANGLKDFDPNMPAILMRDILRQKGLTRISIPNRPLGSSGQPGAMPDATPSTGVESDAVSDLARQWAQSQTTTATTTVEAPTIDLEKAGINELRKECQRLGIKLGRRANMKSMREDIEAHRNGQNAS